MTRKGAETEPTSLVGSPSSDAAVVPLTSEGLAQEPGGEVLMSAEPDSGETAEKLADRPGPGPAARAPSAGRSEPIKNFNRVQDQSLVDWINTLKATGHNIQIRLHRVNPQAWQGRSIKGFLDSYDTPVDEEQIRNLWGGGTYTLKVMRRTDNGGGWVYFTSTTVDIAGDPRVDNLPGRVPETGGGKHAAPEESPLVSRMFDQSMSMMGKAVERAEKAAAGPGSAQLEMMMRPFEMQMQATQRQLEATQAELREARRAPAPSKEDTFKDRWLEKLVDGDSARVTAVREQLQSELRQVKQSAIDDMKRAEDRWDRDMKLRELAFEREMKAKDAAHEMAMSNLKHSHDVTIKVLEGDNRRYERDNNELRLEVKALREKKDQSILDKAKEVEAIANAIGGGQAEEKEKSTIEKIAEVALTSDQLLNFFGKWFKPDGTPAPPPAGAAQNTNGIGAGPDLVRRRSTGEVFRKTAQGYVPVPQPRRRRAVAKVASAEGGVEGDEVEAEIEVDVDDMEKAKNFLEMAFRNNTDPDTVATSARSMVPEGILAVIRDLGVDGFLTKVAKLPSTSPLSSQLGRIWTRKLGKALLGGE